jgi:hypothetical protein
MSPFGKHFFVERRYVTPQKYTNVNFTVLLLTHLLYPATHKLFYVKKMSLHDPVRRFKDGHDPKTEVYVYPDPTRTGFNPYLICSKDDDDPNYRTGMVSIFYERKGRLYGTTTYEIFCRDWKQPNIDTRKSKDNVIGKKARYCRRLCPQPPIHQRKDAFLFGPVFCTVIAVDSTQTHTVVRMEDWVKESPNFQQGGRWMSGKQFAFLDSTPDAYV